MNLYTFTGDRGQWVVAKIKSLTDVAGKIEEGRGQFGDLVVIQKSCLNARVIHQSIGNSGNSGVGKVDVGQFRHGCQAGCEPQWIVVQVQNGKLAQ
ncbi:hypothetical protein D3C84_1086180 [compost metagenome]